MDLDLGRIEEAARIIDPVFRDSPQFVSEQLSAALGRDVLVKVETANPVGSFKGRGADLLVRSVPPGGAVVCASSGNFGLAPAYATRSRGVGVHVYVSPDIHPARRARRHSLGAVVTRGPLHDTPGRRAGRRTTDHAVRPRLPAGARDPDRPDRYVSHLLCAVVHPGRVSAASLAETPLAAGLTLVP